MSDQLAFDFTLSTLQAPAVRFPPHSVPEPEVRRLSALASKPNAPAEDTFIYGGGSAKEAEFSKCLTGYLQKVTGLCIPF